MVLIVRWGRTERQLVQYALHALHTAGAVVSAVILNDVDLKDQQRRGYQDGTVIYTDENLYRAGPEYREHASLTPLAALPHSGAILKNAALRAQGSDTQRNRTRAMDDPVKVSSTDRSDIERFYDRYIGE